MEANWSQRGLFSCHVSGCQATTTTKIKCKGGTAGTDNNDGECAADVKMCIMTTTYEEEACEFVISMFAWTTML